MQPPKQPSKQPSPRVLEIAAKILAEQAQNKHAQMLQAQKPKG